MPQDNSINKHKMIISKIDNLQFDWNKFIIKNSHNPIFLKEFITERSIFYKQNGWECSNIIFFNNNEVIGIIPLRFKKEFSQTFGKFLLQPHFSPDFILSRNNESIIIERFLYTVFSKLGWYYLDLSIPLESRYLNVVKDVCTKKDIHYNIYEGFEHRIIKKESSWEKYFGKLRKKFRKEISRNERNLNKIGERKVTIYENGKIDDKIINNIHNIEKRSWKEAYRKRRSQNQDPDIEMIWNASKEMVFPQTQYNWRIIFIELNGEKIAYAINIQFKNFSTIIKTSFIDMYRKYSPGVQILNEAVKDLYCRDQVQYIDFLTNLPFSRNWSDLIFTRARMILSPHRFVPRGIGYITQPIFGELSIRDFIQSQNNIEMKINVTEELSNYIRRCLRK